MFSARKICSPKKTSAIPAKKAYCPICAIRTFCGPVQTGEHEQCWPGGAREGAQARTIPAGKSGGALGGKLRPTIGVCG